MAEHVIPRTPVVSNWLTSIGYDPERQILAVEFQNQRVWHYTGVPVEKYDAIMTAASHGSVFHKIIKGQHEGAAQPDAPRMGVCPNCGDLGLTDVQCDDCGTARYGDQ